MTPRLEMKGTGHRAPEKELNFFKAGLRLVKKKVCCPWLPLQLSVTTRIATFFGFGIFMKACLDYWEREHHPNKIDTSFVS